MKVGVALSGGVDSATCLYLLKQQNIDAFGMTMLLSDDCEKQLFDVEKICKRLDAEFYVLDYRNEFKEKIINDFEKSIKNHQTIIPCVNCNRYIKFGKMLEFCREKSAKIATGHYAKIINVNGNYEIHRAKDVLKDQTHFLHNVDSNVLEEIIFPLGDFLKSDVYRLAKKEKILNLEQYKESQNVCFFKNKTYEEYVKTVIKSEKSGNILHVKTREKIGLHNGLLKYTTGQRQGIGVAWQEPLYVVDRDFEKNILYVGEEKELFSDKFAIKNINLLLSKKEIFDLFNSNAGNDDSNIHHIDDIDNNNKTKKPFVFKCDVCLRDKTPLIHAKIVMNYNDKTADVYLDKKARAVTSGQSCVFYQSSRMFGGGIIEKNIFDKH